MRLQLNQLKSIANPARSYEHALTRFEGLRNRPSGPLNPISADSLLTHGEMVDDVIVLYHGYTNTPHQFRQLGEHIFERGFNVLIPRMPHHGLADRMTTALVNQTADALNAYANMTLDIACGLGRRITVMGLSAGGVLSAWLAQTRPEVDRAVILSPALGAGMFPSRSISSITRVMLTIPNQYLWWGEEGDMGTTMQHAYPRFSSHGLAQLWRLAAAVRHKATTEKPLARDVIVVFNENDHAIDNELVRQMVLDWQNQGANVRKHTFSAEHGLDHDFIDPDHPEQNTALVYPQLFSLLGL